MVDPRLEQEASLSSVSKDAIDRIRPLDCFVHPLDLDPQALVRPTMIALPHLRLLDLIRRVEGRLPTEMSSRELKRISSRPSRLPLRVD